MIMIMKRQEQRPYQLATFGSQHPYKISETKGKFTRVVEP